LSEGSDGRNATLNAFDLFLKRSEFIAETATNNCRERRVIGTIQKVLELIAFLVPENEMGENKRKNK